MILRSLEVRKGMKVVFYSNYLNHHQLPFCLAMDRLTEGNFTFVATKRASRERRNLGYRDMDGEYPFVLVTYDNSAKREDALKQSEEADLVVVGDAPGVYLEHSIRQRAVTFLYSERLYKQGLLQMFMPKSLLAMVRRNRQYRRNPYYLLCASGFAAWDFSFSRTCVGRSYKWGYFPEVKQYDADLLLSKKSDKPKPLILWAGRLIEVKHPEFAAKLAAELKAAGYDFELKIVGSGELETRLRQSVEAAGLEDSVCLTGAMSPEAVREQMEQADIFLFTSDRYEGWGAVLNESMNSGCAVVASHAIGSVPFLLKDGENGMIFRSKDEKMLLEKTRYLLDHPEERVRMGKAAYKTVSELWSAENAAARLLQLAEDLKATGRSDRFAEGPCSRAKILTDWWYKG